MKISHVNDKCFLNLSSSVEFLKKFEIYLEFFISLVQILNSLSKNMASFNNLTLIESLIYLRHFLSFEFFVDLFRYVVNFTSEEWLFTVIWVTASLFSFQGLFKVFLLNLKLLRPGWSRFFF